MHAQTRACTHASLPLAEFATLIMAPLPSVQPSCRVRLSLMGAPLLPGCHNPLKLGRFKRCAALKESLYWLPVDLKPVLGSSGPCRCCGGSILHNIREQGVVFYELATTTAILGRKAAHCACAPHHNEQQGWLRVAGLNVATTCNGHAVEARYMNANKYSAKDVRLLLWWRTVDAAPSTKSCVAILVRPRSSAIRPIRQQYLQQNEQIFFLPILP